MLGFNSFSFGAKSNLGEDLSYLNSIPQPIKDFRIDSSSLISPFRSNETNLESSALLDTTKVINMFKDSESNVFKTMFLNSCGSVNKHC